MVCSIYFDVEILVVFIYEFLFGDLDDVVFDIVVFVDGISGVIIIY